MTAQPRSTPEEHPEAPDIIQLCVVCSQPCLLGHAYCGDGCQIADGGNPYDDHVRRILGPLYTDPAYRRDCFMLGEMEHEFRANMRRSEFVRRYAWAIPDTESIRIIAQYGPVIEIGAGTGYWAALLVHAGVTITAIDHAVNLTHEHTYHSNSTHFYPVQEGGPEIAALYPDRTLLLSWPPYNEPMGTEALTAHRRKGHVGQHVVFIGEDQGGCTGDDEFHSQLAEHYEEIEHYHLPHWPFVHDRLVVYRRIS